MGFSKEEKSRRILRGFKTVFFLITMMISFLMFSAPVFLVIADTLLPSALLSASLSPPLSLKSLSSHFSNYDFRYSLIDIPLVSIIRSAVIICVYSFYDGPSLSRGPYLRITMICSVSSLIFVSLKAPFVFSSSVPRQGTSCRQRRKLLVYKIDIEAVISLSYQISACKNGFPSYQKILEVNDTTNNEGISTTRNQPFAGFRVFQVKSVTWKSKKLTSSSAVAV
ncbi:uncharacterized protein LOC111296156 isoform X3 [Durio zibethinus]|uniref:Uncharacterized protein LOC111296156 isoform X3 n=1 Tax=Durio zibethinus TaxID=66656 RepID=A0A6P5YZN1_DURZI|nr:uncharacterized protein LOC111296156 isoform X3 [Durio zibethinus]